MATAILTLRNKIILSIIMLSAATMVNFIVAAYLNLYPGVLMVVLSK